MRAIPFTQYIAPTGRPKQVSIEVQDCVADKAETIIKRGFAFECEVLSTGQVSLTVTDPDEGDLDIEVVSNGPGVREAVERMINRFDEGRAA